jgi:hypothetical protein
VRFTLTREIAQLNPADANIFSAPIALRVYLSTRDPREEYGAKCNFS